MLAALQDYLHCAVSTFECALQSMGGASCGESCTLHLVNRFYLLAGCSCQVDPMQLELVWG